MTAVLPGHRCLHGVRRATSQIDGYAGPVFVCDCCRSAFGSLRTQPHPIRCPGCTETKIPSSSSNPAGDNT